MNHEEKLKSVLGILKKMGIDVKMEEESIDALSESMISESILSNKTFTKELIESATSEAKKEVESTIINKLEKQSKELGIDVSDAKGDVKTIMGMVNTHLKKELGKNDDEKAEKILELNRLVQESEVALSGLQKQFDDKETEYSTNLKDTETRLDRRYSDHSIFSSLSLTDSAKKNSKTFFDRLIAPELQGYEENDKGELMKDGKTLLKHEVLGGTAGMEGATRKDLIESKAKQYNYIKTTDTGGSGTPNENSRTTAALTVRKIDNYGSLI